MNKLVFESEGKRYEISLANRPVSLGRSDEADYQLPTKLASRIHAQVFPRERGWWVEDLGSSNGTIVNGNKIGKPLPLVPGDVITLGDINLKFEGAATAPAGPPDHLLARILYTAKGAAPIETLIRDRVTIGRKPDNTLQIDDKVVSGNHVEILNRQGAYILRDLGSSNGTFIKQQRITEHTLRNGDVILIGKKVAVYFVDPAGDAKAAPAAAPQPAAAQSAAAPSAPARPVGGASDRGAFEPVSAPAARSINPLPHIAVGLGLGAVFLLAGWLLGAVIEGFRNRPDVDPNKRVPEAALADKSMSFEGEIDNLGNPEGWTASFENAGGTQAELFSDGEDPFDGFRSLRVSTQNMSGSGTLVLQTTQARKLDLGDAFQMSIAMKGEGAAKVAIALSMIDEKDEVTTLATGSFVGIRGTEWASFKMTGVALTPLPESARLRLLISGGFSKLWIDRVELASTVESRVTRPFADIHSPNLSPRFGASRNAQLTVENKSGHAVALQPRLLASDNRILSEEELWAANRAATDSVTWSAMLAGQGDAAAVSFRMESYDNGYFVDPGLRMSWTLGPGSGATLAVEVRIPVGSDRSTILVADRRGYPLALSRSAVHAYSYATVSEIAVEGTDISVSFPRGAVVWFDTSQRGMLVATVRAAQSENRGSLTIDVNSRPLMFARLYDRLFDEARRLMEADHYSAARERFLFLTKENLPGGDLPVVNRANQKLNEISRHHDQLKQRVDAGWEKASATRSRPALIDARSLLLQYIAEFPGEADVPVMNERLDSIEIWLAEIAANKRTPEEMAEAEATAKSMYEAAVASDAQGNTLLALIMLENILKDYADTTQYLMAQALYDKIQKQLHDPAEQNRVIDAELKGIDEDIKFADWERGRNRCLALFKRFPNTTRGRDIMKRLRIIEGAFED